MAAILNQLQAIFGCLGGPLVLPPEMVEEEEARKERLRAARAARAKAEAESIAAVLPPPEAPEARAPSPVSIAEKIANVQESPVLDFPKDEESEADPAVAADEWGWDDEDEDTDEQATDGTLREEEMLSHAPAFTETPKSLAEAESAPGLEPLTKLPTMEEIQRRAALSGTVHIKTAGNPFLDPLGLGGVVGEGGAYPQTMAAQMGPDEADEADEEEEEEEDFFADMEPTVVPARKVIIDVEQERDAARARSALQYNEDEDEDEDGNEDGFGWQDGMDDGDLAAERGKEKKPQVSKLSGVSFTFEDSDEDLADLDDMDFDGL